MYRKYTTSKTNVINSHNYLVQGQSKDTQQGVVFHQILVTNQYAPLLLNERHLQNYIGQNENQNVVSQTKQGFQTYFDGNLIQIKIKRGVRILTDIAALNLNDMLELLNALNLDYALAVKQIMSSHKYKQKESLNHCCKFYQNFILREGNTETMVPFMQLQSHKIHYYDIYFGSVFPKNNEKTAKSELNTPKNQTGSAKKLKLKNGLTIPSTINQNQSPLINEQGSFKRYLLFLSILFSAEQPNQIIHYLRNTLVQGKFEQQLKLNIDKLRKRQKETSISCLVQLLSRCFTRLEEYNIHIFQKECQLLKDKYLKLKDKTNTYQNSEKGNKIQMFKEDKQKVSKSLITPSSVKQSENCSRDQTVSSNRKRSSGGRLRYSKSEIKLNKSVDKNSFSQGRKLKKATLNMFKDSKIQPSNPLSTLIQQTTKNIKNQKLNNESCFGFTRKSFNFSKMSSNSTNWLNYSSMKEGDVSAKLRNFKKGNHLATTHVSPQNLIVRQDVGNESKQEKQQIKQEIVDRFSRSKAMLVKEQQKSMVRQSRQYTQDQFTMTEVKEQETPQITNNKSLISNKSIMNTLNITLFKEQKRKQAQKKVETPKAKKQSPLAAKKQPTQPKEQPEIKRQPKKIQKRPSKVEQKKPQIPNKALNIPKTPELSDSKMMNNNSALMNSQMLKKSTFQNIQNAFTDQIQQVAFKPKQKTTVQDKKQFQKNKAPIKQPQQQKIQKASEVKPKEPRPSEVKATQQKATEVKTAQQKPSEVKPTEPKKSVRGRTILPQPQKHFYKKYFELILTFFKQNHSKIVNTPHISNLMYLINVLYYKTMIETLKSQSKQKYKLLADLIRKKQAKIPQQMKNDYLVFRVDPQQMFQCSKQLIQLEILINKGTPIETALKSLDPYDQILSFIQITEQACLVIDQLLTQVYSYMQTNKAMLISKDSFGILLQFGYLFTITRIICGQRLNYYKTIESAKAQDLFKVFTFQFKNKEDQYLTEYKKKLAEKDMTFFNVIQEFTQIKMWKERFA